MNEYTTDKIRNIGLMSHASVGKTALAEALVYTSGGVNRMGTTDDGSTLSDYHPDEIERKFSISTSLLHCFWKDHKINVIDTPGYSDFIGEVVGAARVTDTAVILLNGVAGIEVGTESVFRIARDNNVPTLFFVNRCDKEHADYDNVVAQVADSFGTKAVPVHLAVNPGEAFNAIIDLISMKQLTFDEKGKATPGDIPGEMQAKAEEAREKLVEAVAECDDEILEKFFEEGTLSDEDLQKGLRSGIARGDIFPILCGAAAKAIGTAPLLDFVVNYCPDPGFRGEVKGVKPGTSEEIGVPVKNDAPLAALVFKTMSEMHLGELSFFRVFSGKIVSGSDVFNATRGSIEKIGQIYVMNGKQRAEVNALPAGDLGAVVKLKDTHTGNTLCEKGNPICLPEIEFPPPVIRVAVMPKSKGDEDKIATGLHALHEEDPTFVVNIDPELKQTIISGQGELHLDIVVKRLMEKFGVQVDMVEPKIPYRETIRMKAEGQYKHKKQSGGRGQYADVYLRLEPLPRGSEFEFVDQIVGGVVPSKYIPAVEKGVVEAMAEGVISGNPVVDLRVTLYDGSYHSVDSSDMAFKIAASMGFKKLFREANPVLLEPIYELEVRVPEEFMGDVMGDISSRRGKIQGMDSEGQFQVIKAKVPLAELYKYSTKLRSLTQGRGLHRRKFSHYEEVPHEIQEKIIEEYQKSRQQG